MFSSVFVFIHFVFVFLVFQYISFVFFYVLVPTARGRKMKTVECQSMKARMAARDVIRNIAVRVNTFVRVKSKCLKVKMRGAQCSIIF